MLTIIWKNGKNCWTRVEKLGGPPKYEENSNRRQNLEINLYKAIKKRKVSFNSSGDLGKKEKNNEKNSEANTTSTPRINEHINNRIHKNRIKNNSISNSSNIISNSYRKRLEKGQVFEDG